MILAQVLMEQLQVNQQLTDHNQTHQGTFHHPLILLTMQEAAVKLLMDLKQQVIILMEIMGTMLLQADHKQLMNQLQVVTDVMD